MRPYELRRFAELGATRVIVGNRECTLPDLDDRFTKADLETAVSEIRRSAKDISSSLKDNLGEMARGQQEMVRVLSMPTVPVYDSDGKLLGARRAEKL